MNLRRRHAVALVVTLAALPLSGAECLGSDEEREECEAVCAAEAQCDLGRSEAECLAALCADDGFKVVAGDAAAEGEGEAGEGEGEGEGEPALGDHDLQGLSSNNCIASTDDCAEVALCSCEDACARIDECTGSSDAACRDTCENLLEQDTALYLENRCKMESSCADLAACGSVSG